MFVHDKQLQSRYVQFLTTSKTTRIITVLTTLYYKYGQILTKPSQILHCWYHDICMSVMTHFIVVCFKEVLMSAPWRWRDNSAETCRSYVKDCRHKLQTSAFVDVTLVICFHHNARNKQCNSSESCRQMCQYCSQLPLHSNIVYAGFAPITSPVYFST
jgi:hypothetical protein